MVTVLAISEFGRVVFSVVMATLATIGVVVLVNAVRFMWTNRRQR